MGAILLVLQLISSAPPLPPAAAADVLRRCVCRSNRTDILLPMPNGPIVVIIPSSPTSGPFGEFTPFAPIAPLSHQPYIYYPPFVPVLAPTLDSAFWGTPTFLPVSPTHPTRMPPSSTVPNGHRSRR